MTEEWRSVAGWPAYEISSHGNVRSIARKVLRRDGTHQCFASRMLKRSKNTSGYLVVHLRDEANGRSVSARVHRLVATAFLSSDAERTEVNHKDGNKLNPLVSNLEWATPRENRKHAWAIGLRDRSDLPIKSGVSNWAAKLSDQIVMDARQRHSCGVSMRQMAREYGVDSKSMRNAIKGITWRHLPSPPTPGETR